MARGFCWTLVLSLLVPRLAAQQMDPTADRALREIKATYEAAITAMVRGDGRAWQRMLSAGPDVTLFNALGNVRVGQQDVRKQYAWAASHMDPELRRVDIDYLSTTVAGDIACIVAIEHPRWVTRPGAPLRAVVNTRATDIFRREGGRWRLLHRHMDHLPDPESPQPAP
jgi:ketosteroid isomerase-like protein